MGRSSESLINPTSGNTNERFFESPEKVLGDNDRPEFGGSHDDDPTDDADCKEHVEELDRGRRHGSRIAILQAPDHSSSSTLLSQKRHTTCLRARRRKRAAKTLEGGQPRPGERHRRGSEGKPEFA